MVVQRGDLIPYEVTIRHDESLFGKKIGVVAIFEIGPQEDHNENGDADHEKQFHGIRAPKGVIHRHPSFHVPSPFDPCEEKNKERALSERMLLSVYERLWSWLYRLLGRFH